MSVFFTADTHFGHTNILGFCDRPFADSTEMDAALIENWNAVVSKKDTVYHLGDFSFRSSVDHAREVLSKLNGHIHLVVGNHDHQKVTKFDRWVTVSDRKVIRINKKKIILSHYAMRSWPARHHGVIHLYGHSHGNLSVHGKSMDVGVDCHDYRPISYAAVYEFLAERDVYHNSPSPIWRDKPRDAEIVVPDAVMYRLERAKIMIRDANLELARWISALVLPMLEDHTKSDPDRMQEIMEAMPDGVVKNHFSCMAFLIKELRDGERTTTEHLPTWWRDVLSSPLRLTEEYL